MTARPLTFHTAPSRWRLRRWWSRLPRWFIATSVLVFAAGVALGGYYWLVTREKAAVRQTVAASWSAFEKAARSLDEAGMKQALDEVAAVHPDDPLVLRRRRALDEGDADPTDPNMCYVTVLRHIREARWSDAEREADKRLAYESNDWICRCSKVASAFARNDRVAARKLLDELPDPAANGTGINLNGVLFAAQLYRTAGVQPVKLRAFLQSVVVDRLRGLTADADPPAVTVLLLKCYLEAFHPTDPNPPSLALAVADIGRHIGTATAAANDVPTLVQLGETCDRLFGAFDVLRRDGSMTAEQHKDIRADHHARTRAVWQAVRDRAPTEAKAYHGLALAFLRDGQTEKATQIALEGVTAAGDDPALHAVVAVLLQRANEPERAFQLIATAADRDPANVALQLIAAEAAVSANRHELALAACARVYRKEPKNLFAARLEAGAHLRAGDPHRAMQVLSERIGVARLCEDPTAARFYVRSRLEAVGVGLEPFLKQCEDAAVQKQNPQMIAAALAGILDAKFDPAWSATAEQAAARWLERWPGDGNLLRVRAALLARLAERVAPAWSEARVRPAVTAFTDLKRLGGDDADTAAALAWLRLKGERNPAEASAAAALLVAADARGESLTPRQLEVLGAVYLADGKLDPAVRVLELVVRAAPTPTARIHLALAYLKRGRVADARAALDAARATRAEPWTEQEDADYRLTYEALQRETR